MSQENVELIRRGVNAFNRGGFEAVDGVFWSEDIVWDVTPARIPGLGVYRGREEVRKFFEQDWFGAFPFDEWELSADQLIGAGDQVVGLMRQHGRGGSSDADVEMEFSQVATLRDGKVVQVDVYLDHMKALEAAGLSV